MMLDVSANPDLLPRCAERLRNGNNPEDGQEPSARERHETHCKVHFCYQILLPSGNLT